MNLGTAPHCLQFLFRWDAGILVNILHHGLSLTFENRNSIFTLDNFQKVNYSREPPPPQWVRREQVQAQIEQTVERVFS